MGEYDRSSSEEAAGEPGVNLRDWAALYRDALLTLEWGRDIEKAAKKSLPHHYIRVGGQVHPITPLRGRKHKLTVSAWNVRSILDSSDSTDRPARRTSLVAQELPRYAVDIAAFSETRLADEGNLTEVKEGYNFFW